MAALQNEWELRPTDCLAASYCEPSWYAAYISPRHEKKVADHLRSRCVEVYLPLYRANRAYHHRRTIVQLPLFPGYVFTRILLKDRLRVLEVPGVVSLVSSGGRPVPLLEQEIANVRSCLNARQVEPYPYLAAGRRVRVTAGPLTGLEGVVQRRKGRARLIVSIHCLMRSMVLELDVCDVEVLASTAGCRTA